MKLGKLFDKFDFIFIFITLLALIFLVNTYLFKRSIPTFDKTLEVTVTAPVDENVNEAELNNINVLYFSNSGETSKVKALKKVEPGKAEITLENKGELNDDTTIFSGQHVGLNQRVKLHGQLEVEGVVTKIEVK